MINAFAHVIVKEGLADEEWFKTWANVSLEAVWENVLKDKTPEWAEEQSTVPAADIARIAREFAAAAPRALVVGAVVTDDAVCNAGRICGAKPATTCIAATGGVTTDGAVGKGCRTNAVEPATSRIGARGAVS